MEIKIKPVELQEKDGVYEYDFYPGREFSGVKHVLLYQKESWGNLEYLDYFQQNDKLNNQVIIYCSLAVFPLASLCCHKCIMMKTDIYETFYGNAAGYSFYQLDSRALSQKYGIKNFDVTHHIPFNRSYKDIFQLHDILKPVIEKPIYMDVTACERFQKAKHMFKENMVCFEMKRKYEQPIKDFIAGLKNDLLVGYDEKFQIELLTKYDAKDCYLTFQILASLLCKVGFVGIRGAGSLFTLALPINLLMLMDRSDTTIEFNRLARSMVNTAIYGVPTYGFAIDSGMYGNYILEAIREQVIAMEKTTLPEVNFI